MKRVLAICGLFLAVAAAAPAGAQEVLPRPDPPFGGKI
jgi:hypothetical protein